LTIRVLAFARIRELLGTSERAVELPAGARVADAWSALAESAPQLAPLAGSTRVARNGRIARLSDILEDGDELGLLPPTGGG
jgi:molybdopterin converting factor small subunit